MVVSKSLFLIVVVMLVVGLGWVVCGCSSLGSSRSGCVELFVCGVRVCCDTSSLSVCVLTPYSFVGLRCLVMLDFL